MASASVVSRGPFPVMSVWLQVGLSLLHNRSWGQCVPPSVIRRVCSAVHSALAGARRPGACRFGEVGLPSAGTHGRGTVTQHEERPPCGGLVGLFVISTGD